MLYDCSLFLITTRLLCFEEDIEVKRAFIFALIHGWDNAQIDMIREIPKGQLNSHIREIKLSELLNHKEKQRYLVKRWR